MEIAAVTDRFCKLPGGGPALFFERPVDCRLPVVTNLYGSRKRVCMALGIEKLGELTSRMRDLLDPLPDTRVTTLDRQLASCAGFTRFFPHVSAECEPALACAKSSDLTAFPFLQCWPEDGSSTGHPRYMTVAQVHTTGPHGEAPNCGLYRVQVLGADECAIQWKAGSGAARHAEMWRLSGQPMPVAIALGGDPAMLFSAMFPLPGELDEVTFAGFLRGAPLTAAPCSTVPLRVPVGAELVVEGYVQPDDTVMEGPFGNHSGYYSPAAPASRMTVTAVRHRTDAVIPATVVGAPPMEDCWMSLAWERLLLAFIQKSVPLVHDIHFPFEWMFHQSAVISVSDTGPDAVRAIVAALWNLPWFAVSKIVVVVAADAEPLTLPHAAWLLINAAEMRSRIIRDPASPRVAIDATADPLPRRRLAIDSHIEARVRSRWNDYAVT